MKMKILNSLTYEGQRIVSFIYWYNFGHYSVECQHCHTVVATVQEPYTEWICVKCMGVGLVFKK